MDNNSSQFDDCNYDNNIDNGSSDTNENKDMLQYKCDKCELPFINKIWFLRHMAKHDPERFICNYCPKSFKSEDVLAEHTFYHFGRKNFVCNICNKMFSDRRNLNSHKISRHVYNLLPSPKCSKPYHGTRGLRYQLLMTLD